MPFERATTSLQDIESRIRRLFKSAGAIGAKFSPELTPVLLGADLQGPGCNDLRGRRMGGTIYSAAPLANTGYVWQAQTDIVVETIHVDATTTGLATWYLYGPNDVAGAVSIQNTFWQESPVVGDAAPVLSSTAGFGAITLGNLFRRVPIKAGAVSSIIPVGLFLPAGSKLAIHTSGASTDFTASWTGRVF